MGIRSFVKATNRRKPRPIHPNWRELEMPSSPFDEGSESAEAIAEYLATASKLPDQPIDLRKASRPTLHTVRQGQTFETISLDLFGTTEHATQIADANLISPSAQLKVGLILSIPQL